MNGDEEETIGQTVVTTLLCLFAVVVLALLLRSCSDAQAADLTISWTNPAFQADPDTCLSEDSTKVEASLGQMLILATRPGTRDTLALGSKSIFGRQGLRDSVMLSFADSVRYVEVLLRTFDAAVNRACRDAHWLAAFQAKETPPPLEVGNGLVGSYYRGSMGNAFGPLLATRIDSTINFSWGWGAPMVGVPADSFSVRWLGDIVAPVAGTYMVEVTTADGFRAWIDGLLVADHWAGMSGMTPFTWAQTFTGQHQALKVEYFADKGTAGHIWKWTPPGGVKAVVPSSALWH